MTQQNLVLAVDLLLPNFGHSGNPGNCSLSLLAFPLVFNTEERGSVYDY